ncbi:hypothetical protein C8F01DRAFT_1096607 [Mycena amicta]|nr:hypothetical protein C8F01DRAFT_1096607 [Mycena amicta]
MHCSDAGMEEAGVSARVEAEEGVPASQGTLVREAVHGSDGLGWELERRERALNERAWQVFRQAVLWDNASGEAVSIGGACTTATYCKVGPLEAPFRDVVAVSQPELGLWLAVGQRTVLGKSSMS